MRPVTAKRICTPVMALTTYVKGDPATKSLGDCPFCHRVLLTLETKAVPYELGYIDFDHKPEWLLEKSGGKVPIIQEVDFWLPDSDKIVTYLEEKYPNPSMVTKVPPEVGAGFFPAFRGYLTSSQTDEAAKKAELEAVLKTMDDYLASHASEGPFFGGSNLDATDAALAPRLYHAIVALKHFKNWELPSSFVALNTYYNKLKELPAWKNTDYGAECIIKGWARHMAQGH